MNAPRESRISDMASLKAAMADLIALDPSLAEVEIAPLELRLRPPDFEGLADIVVSQLVSRSAARAIQGRLKTLFEPFDYATYLASGEAPLAAGLSRSKHATLMGIAEVAPDLAAIARLPAEEAIAALTAFKGIGPWSAAIFCLFCAGHKDVFATGDIAVHHAMADVLGLTERPTAKQAAKLAERWKPLRGIASRFLYARYGVLRGGSAAPL